MSHTLKTDKTMDLAFLLTLFFMPIEMAMTLRLGSLSPYKISFGVLVVLMIITAIKGNFTVYVNSFIEGFKHFKWAIISIVLYFLFDILSLAWTNDIMFSLKKYVTIAPMFIMAIYATYYFYNPSISPVDRKVRVRNLALVYGSIALVLSLLTWIMYLVFARTYYILTLSLQSDYNQYILPIIIGYVCAVYYINTMRPSWQRYALFVGISTILMPNFYLSGSRRIMVMYMLVFAFLSLYFLISNLSYKKTLSTFILSLALIGGVVLAHNTIIKGFDYYSTYVYKTMEEEAKKQGIKPPSAQMDKSDGIIHGFRLEQDADFKESTLASGEALGRRSALWSIAINEIKSFSIKELFIGKGGSNQRDIYRTDEARAILFPPGTTDPGQDFHPHSMIFLEMVNGGLIKTGSVVSLVLAVVFYDFVLLKRKYYHEFMMVSGYGAIFIASQMIDSFYGLLQNRMTWILLFIVLGALGKLADKKLKRPN